MRLNITRKELGDIILLLMFDKSFDEEFIEQNELFNEVFDALKNRGIDSLLFRTYFDINGNLRRMYRQWKSVFDYDKRRLSIEIFPDELEESVPINQDTEYLKSIIEKTVKKVIKKENLNPEKLKKLQEEILLEGD